MPATTITTYLVGEKAMDSGDPDIVEPLNTVPHDVRRDDRFFRHRQIRGAGGDDENRPAAGWQRRGAQCNGSREFMK